MKHRPFAAALLLVVGVAAGCTSARMSDRETDNLFRAGQYDAAAERLRKGVEEQGESGRDALLYLLDLGLTLHSAGKYEESNKAFLKAEKIAEIKDYTSLSTEGATLLTSDNIKDYKGEDFEKVLINTYLGINFALMGDIENALVEARRVNQKLYRMVNEGERKYKQNAFARYLSAILYESEGNWNDAYIDYKKTWELEPKFPSLGRDLWRLAKLTQNSEDMEKWDAEFNLTPEDHRETLKTVSRVKQPGLAEIIVIYENGISPIKRPHPSFSQVPKFYARANPVMAAQVSVSGPTNAQAETAILHDIEWTAMQNLEEKFGGIIAKKIAGIVAKEVVSDQIGKHTDPLLGLAAKVFFYVSDQADCRSWNLLPHDLQIARLAVAPGTYQVKVSPVGAGSSLPEKTIQIGAGKKAFVSFRYMP